MTHGFWQRQFGGAEAIIGEAIAINGDQVTIVGVLEADFDARSLSPGRAPVPELLLPLHLDPASRDDANNLMAVGRLDVGVTMGVARQQAAAAATAFRASFPGELPTEGGFDVLPLQTVIVGPVRASLLLLVGAVGLAELIPRVCEYGKFAAWPRLFGGGASGRFASRWARAARDSCGSC